jgi:hypothetical protein
MLDVEVVYALAGRQEVTRVRLPQGATLRAALEASGVLRRHPEIDLRGRHRTGIYGIEAGPETVLRDGDRVEIYRPLAADPKEARRARAARARRRLR